jgi:hypothetical protein
MQSGRFDGVGRAHYFSRTKGCVLIAKIAIVAVLASVAPSPPPVFAPLAPSSVRWNGIMLGAPSAPLRSTIGDPLLVTAGTTVRAARYWVAGTKASYFLVIEQDGHVVAFSAFTYPDGTVEAVPSDPSNVSIGESLESAETKHPDFKMAEDSTGATVLAGDLPGGVWVRYRIVNDRVAEFSWNVNRTQSSPALAEIADPAGDSFANAILDMQSDESAGVEWEYRYVAFHFCAEKVHWKMQSQSLLRHEGRAYDRLHVICPATNAERDFYFDITPYFGKI